MIIIPSNPRPEQEKIRDDRVVIVTGASSGIGAAVALGCGGRGMRVVLAARRAERLEEIGRQIEALGGRALVCPADIRDYAQIEAMVKTAHTHFGRIDLLVANAGIGCHEGVATVSAEEMTEVVQTNLLGVMHSARATLPAMLAQRSGHILIVSSVIIGLMWPNDAIYAATKMGLHRFCDGLRQEVRPHGIHVSEVIPGLIDTPLTASLTGNKADAYQTARAILRLLDHPRPTLITPGWYRAAMLLNRLIPGLVDRILASR